MLLVGNILAVLTLIEKLKALQYDTSKRHIIFIEYLDTVIVDENFYLLL